LFIRGQEARENGESCTAGLFRSVRDRKEKQAIVKLIDKEGGVLSKTDEMSEYVEEHFKQFFSERDIVAEKSEMFVNFLSKKVPVEVKEELSSPVTLEEVEGALKRMGKGKVPGVDGLPVEFYVKFFNVLGPYLVEVVREVLGNKNVKGSMTTGVMSLLYKKGERADISNYRPLTMLTQC